MIIPITTNRTISAWVYTQNGDTTLLACSCAVDRGDGAVDPRADLRRRVHERRLRGLAALRRPGRELDLRLVDRLAVAGDLGDQLLVQRRQVRRRVDAAQVGRRRCRRRPRSPAASGGPRAGVVVEVIRRDRLAKLCGEVVLRLVDLVGVGVALLGGVLAAAGGDADDREHEKEDRNDPAHAARRLPAPPAPRTRSARQAAP